MQCNYVITANAKIDCFKLRYNHRDPIILEVNHFLPFFFQEAQGGHQPHGPVNGPLEPKRELGGGQCTVVYKRALNLAKGYRCVLQKKAKANHGAVHPHPTKPISAKQQTYQTVRVYLSHPTTYLVHTY